MATPQCVESEAEVRAPHPGFRDDQYSVLVVVGEYSQTGISGLVVEEVERGELHRSYCCCVTTVVTLLLLQLPDVGMTQSVSL